jgi:sulfur-oxidizing protein SoxY
MTANTFNVGLTRREALNAAIGAIALTGGLFITRSAWAEAITAVMELTGGRTLQLSDRIRLTVPRVFGNGDAVPLIVEVEGPISEADYVKHIHLVAEANPLPEIASFHFTPRSGRARIVTRIRLAQSQEVIALAEMGDGSVLMTKVHVEVGTNGCT